MFREESYEVHTQWGWFRLDAGAYRDYLAGKLWICRAPGKPAPPREEEAALPPEVTEEALRLRDAARRDVFLLLQERCPGRQIEIPYRARMQEVSIDELPLSVRSSNGLRRAGADRFGRLWTLLNRENGLRSVRNLGEKSEREILRAFLTACYQRLSPGEQALYWQNILDTTAP